MKDVALSNTPDAPSVGGSSLPREKNKKKANTRCVMQAIPMGQTAIGNHVGLPTGQSSGPEKKFRAGGISATVWKNNRQRATGETYAYHTVSLERSYKDQAGNWKNASSFRLQDLPKAALLLNEVFRHLTLSGAHEDEVVVE